MAETDHHINHHHHHSPTDLFCGKSLKRWAGGEIGEQGRWDIRI